MKELFVLYGRVDWADGIYSEFTNEYFGEAPVVELFEDFQSAYERFQCYVKRAYQLFVENPPIALDEDCIEKSKNATLFKNYNMKKKEFSYGDVQWMFTLNKNESASWQMYAVNVYTEECPILAGLHIAKKIINPEPIQF